VPTRSRVITDFDGWFSLAAYLNLVENMVMYGTGSTGNSRNCFRSVQEWNTASRACSEAFSLCPPTW
jgi:hypothetical protein